MVRAENDGQHVTAIVKEERWAIKVTHGGQALTALGRLLGPSGQQANRGGGGGNPLTSLLHRIQWEGQQTRATTQQQLG